MKKYLSIVVFIGISVSLFQSCKDSSAFSKQSGEDPALTSSDHLTMAVLYQQTAAEYRALCYQAFNVAKYQLDQNLRIMGLQRQQAVVVDIDETVLDNSPYEAKCILENVSYPDYWDEWMNASDAEPVPGVLEFLKYAKSKSIEIYYITNRKEKYREQTLKNLKSLGFPNAENKYLMLKTDESSKKGRRDMVSETCKIIMLIGDNLNDFSEVFEKKSIPERFELTDKMKKDFGSRFIVLPNAMYGEWEGALYDYDYSKSETEKSEIRHKKLISF
ncbi:MAG: 5'-nucleotidase, lipoprotein e(P4) family [Bacteroidales bacterium]|nr:5'-nucleotidase, lipoprotein e(P4) family [Bacteroidales bacterium]